MDGGAQTGLVAMAGHAFGIGNLDIRERCFLQWDLGVSASPARVACPRLKPSRSQIRAGNAYRREYIFPVLVIRGQFCADSARGPQGVETFYLLKSAAIILNLLSHSLPSHVFQFDGLCV